MTDATYTDTLDNMVNVVNIYNDSMRKVGQVKNKRILTLMVCTRKQKKQEKGKDAKRVQAKLTGITKECSIEAIGDVRAISERVSQ